jgi:hypothetical protein
MEREEVEGWHVDLSLSLSHTHIHTHTRETPGKRKGNLQMYSACAVHRNHRHVSRIGISASGFNLTSSSEEFQVRSLTVGFVCVD